jgi:dTDP-4-dehydrorhamnose 3,5-epimerase and related enzymes
MTEQFFGKELAARKIEAIPGMIEFDIPVHGDNRGWFKENFQKEKCFLLVSQNHSLQKENYKITLAFHIKTFCVDFMQNLGTNTSQLPTKVKF